MIMSTYDEIAKGLREYADKIGGKANMMRFLNAKKATIYRALEDDEPSLPAPDVLCEWLDKINERYAPLSVQGDELDKFRVFGRVRWFGRVL